MSRRSKIRAEDKMRTVKECIHGNIAGLYHEMLYPYVLQQIQTFARIMKRRKLSIPREIEHRDR